MHLLDLENVLAFLYNIEVTLIPRRYRGQLGARKSRDGVEIQTIDACEGEICDDGAKHCTLKSVRQGWYVLQVIHGTGGLGQIVGEEDK